MKTYDYKLARKIIETFTGLTEVEDVWKNGEFLHGLPENADSLQEEFDMARKNGMGIYLATKNEEGFHDINPEYTRLNAHCIAGIYGSDWATPVIQVDLANGECHVFKCYKSDGEEADITETIEKMAHWSSGVLSGPVNEDRLSMEVKEFKQTQP